MKRVELIILTLLLVGCTENPSEKTGKEQVQKDTVEVENIQHSRIDTFTTKGNEIVFFKPTAEEYRLMIDSDGVESGLPEVESDFTYYVGEFAKTFESEDYSIVLYPSESIIEIVEFDGSVSYLDRVDNSQHHYGLILNSNDVEAQIEFGVFSLTDLKMMVEEKTEDNKRI